MLDGKESIWSKGSADGLTVRADGAYSFFVEVSVNGRALAADQFDTSRGSAIVTLKSSYLETLPEGTTRCALLSRMVMPKQYLP